LPIYRRRGSFAKIDFGELYEAVFDSEAGGRKLLLLIWDNASWHISREVRRWLGRHNRKVKKSGEGVRIVSCLLPKQSPWLNAIEPKWVFTASGKWSSSTVCSAPMNSQIGPVEFSAVLMSLTHPFPGRSPDRALGTGVKIASVAVLFSWCRGDPVRVMDHFGE
jgi:hypothetical protein